MAIALAANALISKEELLAMLQVTLTDDIAHMLINVASQQAETIANRRFIKQEYTLESYTIRETTKYLLLKNYPINTVTLVREYDVANSEVIYDYTVNTEYQIYSNEGYLYFYGRVPRGHNNMKITYDAGWLVASVPYDLKSAVGQLCGFYNTNKMVAGVSAERIGNYSVNYAGVSGGGAIPENIYSIIASYKRDVL